MPAYTQTNIPPEPLNEDFSQLPESSATSVDVDPEQGSLSLLKKVKSRVQRDVKSALIDTAEKPTGDFDLLADRSSRSNADRVSSFNALITTLRLATMTISLLLVSADSSSDHHRH